MEDSMYNLTSNEIITCLSSEFRGDLHDGSKRSNPIKVEGENYYLIMILSYNSCCEKFFLIRPELPEYKRVIKYESPSNIPISIKASAKIKDNIVTVSCKVLKDNSDLNFGLCVND